MRRYRLGLLISVVVVLTYACSGKDDTSSQGNDLLDPSCVNDTGSPPKTLLCTGLYKDIKAKTVAANIQAYAPATPLWSDGAVKTRWVQIPAGKTIDRTDPSEWKYPIGTTAWKEFKVANKRVETRMWRKVSDQSWVNATYAWNSDESSATYSSGGDVNGPAGTYHIPTSDECEECHRGRKDRILGFEEVSLGLADATGYTLAKLVSDKKLTPPPPATSLTLGDDGTNGANAPAMRWLHVNCGITCHNTNQDSLAYAAGMNLRMDPLTLTGGSSSNFDNRHTTLNIPAKSPSWAGISRIVPGDPDDSLIVQLISNRTDGNQMPPIATRVVDDADVALVRAWITAMGPPPAKGDDDDDAGTSDAGENDAGGTDAGETDSGGTTDSGSPQDAGKEPTDAGTLCAAGSVEETEPNNGQNKADMMKSGSGSFCGRITPGDDDWFSFTMPAGTTSWTISDADQGGTVTITGTVNGQNFTLSSGGSYPFAPGSTYLFHATAPGAAGNVDYSVTISVTP